MNLPDAPPPGASSVSTTMAQQGLLLPLHGQRVEAKGRKQSRQGRSPGLGGRAAAQSRRLSLEAPSPPQDPGCVTAFRSRHLVGPSASLVTSGVIRFSSSLTHEEAGGREGPAVGSGRSSGSSSGLASRHVQASGVRVPSWSLCTPAGLASTVARPAARRAAGSTRSSSLSGTSSQTSLRGLPAGKAAFGKFADT